MCFLPVLQFRSHFFQIIICTFRVCLKSFFHNPVNFSVTGRIHFIHRFHLIKKQTELLIRRHLPGQALIHSLADLITVIYVFRHLCSNYRKQDTLSIFLQIQILHTYRKIPKTSLLYFLQTVQKSLKHSNQLFLRNPARYPKIFFHIPSGWIIKHNICAFLCLELVTYMKNPGKIRKISQFSRSGKCLRCRFTLFLQFLYQNLFFNSAMPPFKKTLF